MCATYVVCKDDADLADGLTLEDRMDDADERDYHGLTIIADYDSQRREAFCDAWMDLQDCEDWATM